jgi:hypothetical protein
MQSGELEAVTEVLSGTDNGGSQLDEREAVEQLLTNELESDTEQPERAQEAAPDREVNAEPEADGGDTTEPQEAKSGIDYGLEVPMADGQKVPLGELKDHYQEYQQRLADVQTRENEAHKQYQDVQYFMGLIKDHVPPERIQQIQAEQKAYMDQQHALMVETVPEMATREGYEKLKGRMLKLGAEYGVEHLVGRIDAAGFVKMMRDYIDLRDGIKRAKSNVKPLRGKEPRAKQKPEGKQADTQRAIERAKRTHNHQDEVAAINQLLG